MKITDAKATGRFEAFLRFDDGSSGNVDLAHLAGRGVFSAWLKQGVFEQLSVSTDGALQWPGDLDLCPDSLYLLLTGKTVAEVFPTLRPSLANAWDQPFYGIVIHIYYGDHPPPHFHALYAGAVVKIVIGTLEIIGGSLPRRALSLVLDRAAIHQQELLEAFNRTAALEAPCKIAPLE